jgi:hypothetical protein
MASYEGDVGFGSDGVHYPLDEDGHLDTSRPLRFEDGAYRDATEGEPTHNETYQANDRVVHPEHVAAPVPGQEFYPAGVHVVSYEPGVYYLLDANDVVDADHPLAWDPETERFVAAGGGS